MSMWNLQLSDPVASVFRRSDAHVRTRTRLLVNGFFNEYMNARRAVSTPCHSDVTFHSSIAHYAILRSRGEIMRFANESAAQEKFLSAGTASQRNFNSG